MLITDKNQLKMCETGKRVWQGIPSVERTEGGRLFAAFYSGNVGERPGNYVVLLKSDDDGTTWSEPVACAYAGSNARCYDQCLWIDPSGRLWFMWSRSPKHAVYAALCDDPDAETLCWSEEREIGHDVMLNRPTVLSGGEWLFPMAVWDKDVYVCWRTESRESGPFVYRSMDEGKNFERLGCPYVTDRSCDEHMVMEREDGTLEMYTRTHYGISRSYSYDGGLTWTDAADSGLGGPDSRFHIRKLRSGRWMLINHYQFSGRNNLTAFLSEDEGKTWPYHLLLDERSGVSYPDMAEARDGVLYIIYDHERGDRSSYEEARKASREILMARITEQDILAGRLVSEGSRLRTVVSRLGEYEGDMQELCELYK